MVHTNNVNYINSQETLMSPLDSSPDSDSIPFLFRLGLSVRSLLVSLPILGGTPTLPILSKMAKSPYFKGISLFFVEFLRFSL